MSPAWGSAARVQAAPGRRPAPVDLQYAAVMWSRKPLLRNADWGINGQLVCSAWAYVSVKATRRAAHGFEQRRQSLVMVIYYSFVDFTETVSEYQKKILLRSLKNVASFLDSFHDSTMKAQSGRNWHD